MVILFSFFSKKGVCVLCGGFLFFFVDLLFSSFVCFCFKNKQSHSLIRIFSQSSQTQNSNFLNPIKRTRKKNSKQHTFFFFEKFVLWKKLLLRKSFAHDLLSSIPRGKRKEERATTTYAFSRQTFLLCFLFRIFVLSMLFFSFLFSMNRIKKEKKCFELEGFHFRCALCLSSKHKEFCSQKVCIPFLQPVSRTFVPACFASKVKVD